jgi:atypical dual specificity phosphatase
MLIPTLEALYQLAIRICAEVERAQPGVVIGLAHSGWMPVALAGELWAGAYPHYEHAGQVEMIKDLLKVGVRCFVDLTEAGDFRTRHAYLETLQQASQELGVAAERVHFPLRLRAAPTRLRMGALLEEIGSRVERGEGVYVHGDHNMDGRAPMVLACLLIEGGSSPQDALAQVTELWLETLPYLVHMPFTHPQQKFILHWC